MLTNSDLAFQEGEVRIGDQVWPVVDFDQHKFFTQVFYAGFKMQQIGDHVKAVRDMEMRDDDVILAAYPKSGTHLIREVVHMLQVGRIEYIGAENLDFPIEYRNPQEVAQVKSPRVLHTHLPYRSLPKQLRGGRGKIIALLRNPKDICVSFWHFLQHLSSASSPLEDFIRVFTNSELTGKNWYEWRHELATEHESDRDVQLLVVTYEDCISDLEKVTLKIARFLGKTYSVEFIQGIVRACEINTMREGKIKAQPRDIQERIRDGYTIYYRKGIVGDWKTTFTSAENATFDRWIESQEDDGRTQFPLYKNFY